jgi:hypothetical protein
MISRNFKDFLHRNCLIKCKRRLIKMKNKIFNNYSLIIPTNKIIMTSLIKIIINQI